MCHKCNCLQYFHSFHSDGTLSLRCWFLFSSSFCSFSLHHFYPCSCFIFLFCGTVLFFVIFVDFIRFFMVLGRSRAVNTHKRRNRSESSSMKNRSNIWVFDAAFRMCVKLWTYLFDIECRTNANVVCVRWESMDEKSACTIFHLVVTNQYWFIYSEYNIFAQVDAFQWRIECV